jgi:hypothetical protein
MRISVICVLCITCFLNYERSIVGLKPITLILENLTGKNGSREQNLSEYSNTKKLLYPEKLA